MILRVHLGAGALQTLRKDGARTSHLGDGLWEIEWKPASVIDVSIDEENYQDFLKSEEQARAVREMDECSVMTTADGKRFLLLNTRDARLRELVSLDTPDDRPERFAHPRPASFIDIARLEEVNASVDAMRASLFGTTTREPETPVRPTVVSLLYQVAHAGHEVSVYEATQLYELAKTLENFLGALVPLGRNLKR
ncbi:MAG TPA: hypothetical protein VKX46_02950 [Ktedonobacteraceae bacterium]|nr:hypothetical protein [Ktedonobacteraceae bacterium]